jgi:chromosome segregation ATPase
VSRAVSTKRVPRTIQRFIEEKLATVEARLLNKINAERSAREKEGAADEENFEAITTRIDALQNEQNRWIGRIQWVEEHLDGWRPPPRRRRRKA